MSILTVVQEGAVKMGIAVPSVVYSATDRTSIEIKEYIRRAADYVWRDYDWELLRATGTFNGDGSSTSFTLPTDFGRMIEDGKMWSSELESPLGHVQSSDDWLQQTVRSQSFLTGVWHKIGGVIEIKPAPSSGATVKFIYIKNTIVSPSVGDDATDFTLDTDSFVLNEDLLKLCLIWMWRQGHGIEYAEELADYETLKGQLIKQDGGPKMIRVGRVRAFSGVRVAYPKVISA